MQMMVGGSNSNIGNRQEDLFVLPFLPKAMLMPPSREQFQYRTVIQRQISSQIPIQFPAISSISCWDNGSSCLGQKKDIFYSPFMQRPPARDGPACCPQTSQRSSCHKSCPSSQKIQRQISKARYLSSFAAVHRLSLLVLLHFLQ